MENEKTIVIDGVIYSEDKKVLIKYPKDKKEEKLFIPNFVEELGSKCFSEVENKINIYIGSNLKKLHNGAFENIQSAIEKIYVPATVEEIEGEIFEIIPEELGCSYCIDIVGGKKGSAIEYYCNERNITFVEVKESDVEWFYATPCKELAFMAKEQAVKDSEINICDNEKGYQLKSTKGTLEIIAIKNDNVKLEETRPYINKFYRELVKKIIIGKGITEIADFAFEDYKNLEQIVISDSVSKISSVAFLGKEEYDSWGCPKLSSIIVDKNNKNYKSIDGVLFTYDMKTLVKHPQAKPDLYYEVDARVSNIGDYAFSNVNKLQCLKVGENCRSVGECAFLNISSLRHIYFASSVTKWPSYFPFFEQVGLEMPYRLTGIVIGGEKNSTIHKLCNKNASHFHVIEIEDIDNFLAVPLPSEEDDRYYQDCLKEMLITEDGTLEQIGEFGDELIFPEGVVRTHYRIDLSMCKKVSIPTTMCHFWTQGLDGPALNLSEFIVSKENQVYTSIGGHLYDKGGTLLVYAPGVKEVGVIPEGTVKISEGAFGLIGQPIEKLYIPKTITDIKIPNFIYGWFLEVDVSPENKNFKAIDNSLFTFDGKKLVCCKTLSNGYVVPDGTEIIGEDALKFVKGIIEIPASVEYIDDLFGLSREDVKVRTAKGTFAEAFAINNNVKCEIVLENGEIEIFEPKKEISFKRTLDDDLPF